MELWRSGEAGVLEFVSGLWLMWRMCCDIRRVAQAHLTMIQLFYEKDILDVDHCLEARFAFISL